MEGYGILGYYWKSEMSRQTKIKIFRTAVEPVLLYGCETWTLKQCQNDELDGVYTWLLRRAFNISWKSHTTNKVLYGNIPHVSTTIYKRRLKFTGHLQRHPDQPAHQLLFWKPPHGKRYRGRPFLTYTDVLEKDTELGGKKLCTVMMDRDEWKAVTKDSLQRHGMP